MKRISTATAVPGKFGPGKNGFTDGSLVGGVPATDLQADWFDHMQEEVANVVEDLGVALDPNDRKQLLAALKGRLLGVRIFTTTTTYVPTPGTKFIRLRLLGAGAAGGGATTTGASAVSAGAGGGGGAYLEAILTAGFANQLLQIGAGGSPNLGLTGGDGGASSFAGLIAQGGKGGPMYGPGAVPLTAAMGNSATASGGYLQVPGQNSGAIFIVNTSVGLSGVGANSIWGSGAGAANGGDGAAGTGFGSGGSGAITFPNQAARIGGAGRNGMAIIEEFA